MTTIIGTAQGSSCSAKRGELAAGAGLGTGFKQRDALQLRKMMDRLAWKGKQPPVAYARDRTVTWVQPTLIAEIEARGRSSDSELRHSSYKGLR